mgnify:CR=1 FL=1
MARTLVSPRTVAFVNQAGCSGPCGAVININNGIPLECKEWTNEESALLRERMLKDNQLFSSGLVRRIERSSLGNSLRIKKSGIDVGPIRTQDSGAQKENECKVMFDGITVKEFEKTFYVVNTTKNVQFCTKDFIGTAWQDLIGNAISDYEPDAFANTDLATIIIAAIIDRYKEFMPRFMLLAACGGAGDGLHGDDGILAKAYYASMNQYFHLISYNLTDFVSGFANIYINAIFGGAQYDTAPTSFSTAQLYILDFVYWLNGLIVNGVSLVTATFDITTSVVTIQSNIVTKDIDLRIILNEGISVDWSCKQAKIDELVYTLYENSMLINDVPLLFDYEPIDITNFAQLFMQYKRTFFTYLHNNGFEDIAPSEVLIGIDPLLLIERQAQIDTQAISGNVNTNFMDLIGLQTSQFVPLNVLTATGLFFITIKGNLLLLDDGENVMNMLDNFGRILIEKACNDSPGMVNILGGVPPIGSSVESWGVFASNLIGSRFVLENKLSAREPCEAAKMQIACYDSNVKKHCQVYATCEITTSGTAEAEYEAISDETTITVSLETFGADGTLAYLINWALSDGTGSSAVTTPNFVITLPGDQTENGLRLSVTGSVNSSGLDVCTGYFAYATQFGNGSGVTYCTATGTNDQVANSITTALSISYEIDGNTETVALTNAALSLNTVGDYGAIELEIEAILAGISATLVKPATTVTFSISNLPSFISNVILTSATTTNSTAALTINC